MTIQNTPSYIDKRSIIEASVGLLLLVLAFFAVASSDVSATVTYKYWTALVLLFGVIAFISDRLYTDHAVTNVKSGLTIVLHWLGVFLAMEMVYYFVLSGRIANADTGLTNALILALGAFLFGVHGNWRFVVIGLSLAATTWIVAFVEEYMWVLLVVAAATLLILLLGAKLKHRFLSKNPIA
jgi:hypothetical protein